MKDRAYELGIGEMAEVRFNKKGNLPARRVRVQVVDLREFLSYSARPLLV